MPLSCILYDLDGTLVDTAADIAIAANRTRHHFRLPPLSEADIRAFIGDGARKLVERAVFGIVDDPIYRPEKRLPRSGADIEDVVELFRGFYSEDPVIESSTAKGADRVLAHWQAEGVAQVCLTNKPHELTGPVLDQLGLTPYFDLVVGAGAPDDDGNPLPRKPDVTVLDYVLDQTGAERSETVIVGDGLPDFELARRGGIPCIALLCGYTDPDTVLANVENLDLVATSFKRAGELLDELNQSI